MEKDVEAASALDKVLTNNETKSFSWSNVGVVVKDRKTKQPLSILTSSSGHVGAGNLLTIMGPSGSGKTTLLNVLAHRAAAANAQVTGNIFIDDFKASQNLIRQMSIYVEQDDSLIGSLTVKETVDFAARLSLPSTTSRQERMARVNDLVTAFGLDRQSDIIVGTPIRKGISGGQKRRLGVTSQLITSPKILFLDEPTSGLDSAASYEVMNFIREVAKKHKLIVIASIHQPSTTTFELFDQLLLLSHGRTCYFGTTEKLRGYFGGISSPIPSHTNPSEFLLDLVNDDFSKDKQASHDQLQAIFTSWDQSAEAATIKDLVSNSNGQHENGSVEASSRPPANGPSALMLPIILLHRNFIKSYRDVVAYGVRIVMYFGLAILCGTVWLRLGYTQTSIQPFINNLFFGGAFMSFMAVAYVPAIVEDLATFKKERANGLYGPLPFIIANFLIGLPYLFIIAALYSIITYWLCNFRSSGSGFFYYLFWLFLDLVAAEGLVVLVTTIAPIFVVSLAITAFANGLWMCVGGFLVPLGTLNVFWKYVFHYIDYQAYVFQGLMVNQFESSIYDCQGGHCLFPSDLESEGKIRGTAVLEAYHIARGKTGEWVGIMISIIVAYRILGYLVLSLRKH